MKYGLPSKEERLNKRKEFIKRWPLEKIKNMTLEQYTDNSNKDAFWYWVDFKSTPFIKFGKGLAYTYGIYMYKQISGKTPYFRKDDQYAWFKKYGITADGAFENIKSKIINIIEYSLQNNKNAIEKIDFPSAIKWEIAILYNPEKYVTIVHKKALEDAAEQKGLENPHSKTIAELQNFLVSKRSENMDYMDYSDEIWYNTLGKNFNTKHKNMAEKDKNYWFFVPGEKAEFWNEFYDEGILGIGWDDIEDLEKLSSKQTIEHMVNEKYPTENKKNNIIGVLYDFKNNMQIGDIVIAENGRKEILGWGILISDCYYDSSRDTYKKCRKVDWKTKIKLKSDNALPLKKLTNITNNTKYLEILKLLCIETKVETEHITQSHTISTNIILYGPPGTGKTYKTFDRAVEIVSNNEYESKNHGHNVEIFRKYLNKRTFFITFHQTYGYEEFVGGLRPVETGETLKFKWKPGIFIKACAAAFKNNSDNKTVTDEDVSKFLEACEHHPDDLLQENAYERNHNVVLIIDEINRANISRVFGELITLIEEDKKIGGKHGLILTLPNDKRFGVPRNLFILGTMNTADKSIAHLDAALRRRFDFIPLYPDFDKIQDKNKKLFLKRLNELIYQEKKSADLLIGHSYFMDDNKLDEIIKRKIVPLLMEYFSSDVEKVGKILEQTGSKIRYNSENYIWE